MMPNIDPKQLKRMMESMGIKSSEISAGRVVIECADRNIVIDNPQVTAIDAQGSRSFQISGSVREEERKAERMEISDEDVRIVMKSAGISDETAAQGALEATNGDIAEAIIRLKENGS